MWSKIKARFRSYFLAGILVLIPGVVTLLVLYWLVVWISKLLRFGIIPVILNRILPVPKQPEWLYSLYQAGLGTVDFILGLVLVLATILVAGAWARSFVIRGLLAWSGRLFDRIPAAGIVYKATRQLLSSALGQDTVSFRRVVLVQYPNENNWVLGLVSGECGPVINNAMGEKSLYVFIPTTPNPSNGFLVITPERAARNVDMTVREAFQIIISGGIAAPYGPGESGNRLEASK